MRLTKIQRERLIGPISKTIGQKRSLEPNVFSILFKCINKIQEEFKEEGITHPRRKWIKIEKFDPKEKQEKIQNYQTRENIILINFKTKINKNDYQQHYQCRSQPDCPFQIKLSEKDSKVQMFIFGQHSHNKDLESLGNFCSHLNMFKPFFFKKKLLLMASIHC